MHNMSLTPTARTNGKSRAVDQPDEIARQNISPPADVDPASPVTPEIPGPHFPTVPFPPGTTIASLPARTEGPVASTKRTELALILTHGHFLPFPPTTTSDSI